MIRLIKYGLIAAVVLVLAAGAIVLFAPAERYRESVTAAVTDATGGTLTIAGGMRFVFTPELAIQAADVTLADDAGAVVAKAAHATLAVEIFPLLTGDLKPTRLALSDCTIDLAALAQTKLLDPAAPPELGDVALSACTIAAADGAGVAVPELRLRWPRAMATLSAVGEIVIRGETIGFDAAIEDPRALLRGGRAGIKAELHGALLKGTVDGDANFAAADFEGGINISAGSARRLAQLFGVAIPGDRGFGELSLAAAARIQPGEAHFRDARFTLDGMTGGGAFGIRLARGVPSIAGSINTDRFDLGAYLSLMEPEDAPDDQSGWSDAAFDFSALAGAGIDLGIKAKRAIIFGVGLRDTDLSLSAGNGSVALQVNRGTLYGGAVRADMRADVNGEVPRIWFAASLGDADAQSVLPDIAGVDTLTGRVTLVVGLSGQGKSQRELVRHLSGTAEIELHDGAFTGVDLATVAATLPRAEGFEGVGEDEATNLASLAARFAIEDGVARTDALTLIGPFVRMQGKGDINLPGRLIGLSLEPRFVTDIDGRRGSNAPGVAMPFRVTGPWAAPLYLPDAQLLVARAAAGEVSLEEMEALPPAVRDWLDDQIATEIVTPGDQSEPERGNP